MKNYLLLQARNYRGISLTETLLALSIGSLALLATIPVIIPAKAWILDQQVKKQQFHQVIALKALLTHDIFHANHRVCLDQALSGLSLFHRDQSQPIPAAFWPWPNPNLSQLSISQGSSAIFTQRVGKPFIYQAKGSVIHLPLPTLNDSPFISNDTEFKKGDKLWLTDCQNTQAVTVVQTGGYINQLQQRVTWLLIDQPASLESGLVAQDIRSAWVAYNRSGTMELFSHHGQALASQIQKLSMFTVKYHPEGLTINLAFADDNNQAQWSFEVPLHTNGS